MFDSFVSHLLLPQATYSLNQMLLKTLLVTFFEIRRVQHNRRIIDPLYEQLEPLQNCQTIGKYC